MNQSFVTDSPMKPKEEYLLFSLGAEEYAVDLLKVQEIRSYEAVTRIVNTPEFIKGMINLRGEIVPIADLRLRFGLPEVTYTPFTVVIILNVLNRTVGFVVDGVSDVVNLSKDDIRPAPDVGVAVDNNFVTGLASVDGRLVILLDIDKMVGSRELALVAATAPSGLSSPELH